MSARRVHGMTLVNRSLVNRSAGYYHPGQMYDHRIKMEVGQAYISLFQKHFSTCPSTRAVAAKARVEKGYASKVIEELVQSRTLMDPEILKQRQLDKRVPTFHLSVEEEVFLLSLSNRKPK
jgi:hypothetical protein